MKKLTIMTMVICLITFSVMAQHSGYSITGNIKNLPDGITFYLIQSKKTGGADTTAKVKSKNNQFAIKGSLKEEGQLAFVKMDTSVYKVPEGKQTWVRLLLDNSGENIKLTGDLSEWPGIKIEGSTVTADFDKVTSIIKSLQADFVDKLGKISGDPLKKTQLEKEYNVEYIKVLHGIPGSATLPFFILNNGAFEPEDMEAEYAKLSDRLKSSYYGKKLIQHVASMKASKTIGIGKVIPDFQVKTPERKLESIRKLAMNSKYTLVDFWAWWCAPCRADIPNLKKVYSTFQDKGFNILSVSTDPNDAKWRQALKEENTPWVNGMQEGNPSNDIFGLVSIPAYILLNDKAEIVQMDLNSKYFSKEKAVTLNGAPARLQNANTKRLRGEDLYKTIEGLLGETKK